MTRALTPSPRSFVYVIGRDDGPQKVGFSQFPNARAKGLKPTGKPHLKVHAHVAVMADVVREIEALAHWLLRDHALGGELFDVTPERAAQAIAEAAERHAAGQRAPKPDTGRYQVAVPQAWIERLDEWRAQQRPVLTKAEAVRQLVTEALDAREKPQK